MSKEKDPLSALRASVEARKELSEPVEAPKFERWVPTTKHRDSWKDFIKQIGGNNGERWLQNLASIADGNAWIPRLADGREGPPVIPSTADRNAANIYILNMMHGKPVDQTKVVKAEKEARKSLDLSTVPDIELRKEAAKYLKAGSFLVNELLPPEERIDVPEPPKEEEE